VTPSLEQTTPNAFEVAILETMARERPSLHLDHAHLQVQSRRYTGVGSYTDFLCDEAGERSTVSMKASIAMPGVPSGMGAVLFYRGEQPTCLETFTYGDDFWTGAFEGFSVG
jgi:hypothetical protein